MKQPYKKYLLGIIALWACGGIAAAFAENPAATVKPVHGAYRDWRVLGVSHRLDKKYVRAILGNDIAINAGRTAKTNPWPDGSIIAKLSWKEHSHERWPQAVIPGEFAGAEAMIKDSKKYPETGGWAFAHWEGGNLVINDQEKTATCFACHTIMKDRDYVFTEPALQ